MRISPPPEDGLHPAFPPSPDPSRSNTVLPTTVFAATSLGALRWIFAATFRRPAPLASACKTVAYAATSLGATLSILQDLNAIAVRKFLASQNVECPAPKFFDRLGNFDQDDRLFLGGCIGVFAATRMRGPWTVTGWKRSVAAFTLGSFASDIVYGSYRTWSWDVGETKRYLQEHQKWVAQRDE